MDFEIIGDITAVKTIAKGKGVRDRARLRKCTAARDGVNLKVLPKCGCRVVGYAWLKFTGMKRTVSGSENSN